MTYALRFLPAVEEDFLIAYRWYERKTPGLGEEFLRAFLAASKEVPRNPLLYAKIWDDFRRLLLRRFPYAMYFRIHGDEIIDLGVFHSARDPQALRAQLLEREDTAS